MISWRVVTAPGGGGTSVMSRYSVSVTLSLAEPHRGHLSGVCSSNSVGLVLLVAPRWPTGAPRGLPALPAPPFSCIFFCRLPCRLSALCDGGVFALS